MNAQGQQRNLPLEGALPESRPMVTVRVATIADIALIGSFIAELAAYDNELSQVCTTETDLVRDGFGENPQYRVLIGEWCGQPVGFAVFFSYYSTWRGAGLYLEDLFVCPEFRRRGIGTALLAMVARTAERENRNFVRWVVLNWNQPAREMYRSLGAEVLDEWRVFLLSGEELRQLAARNA